MRILFFSSVFPNPAEPHKGTFNLCALKALAEGHAVRVVSPVSWVTEWTSRLRGEERIQRRQATYLGGAWVEYPRFYYPPKVLRPFYDRFLQWSVGRKLRRTAESFRPDAVVSYWSHPDGAVANRLARRLGVPSVIMVGGSDVLVLGRRGSRRRAVLGALRSADAVITVSRHLAEHVVRAGIPEEKVHVVYRGVDREMFRPGDREGARRKLGIPSEARVLVSVGRLVPVKGFSVLIDACRALRAWDSKIACYVLGGGGLAGSLRREVESKGLEGVVHFCGPQPQKELARWYQAADVVVLPSLSEGIPNVLLEGMACGRPFVASGVGGVPEIADPEWDRLVRPGDPRELAAAIQSRLEERNGCGVRRFEAPTWKESADGLAKVIGGLCGARSGAKQPEGEGGRAAERVELQAAGARG